MHFLKRVFMVLVLLSIFLKCSLYIPLFIIPYFFLAVSFRLYFFLFQKGVFFYSLFLPLFLLHPSLLHLPCFPSLPSSFLNAHVPVLKRPKEKDIQNLKGFQAPQRAGKKSQCRPINVGHYSLLHQSRVTTCRGPPSDWVCMNY